MTEKSSPAMARADAAPDPKHVRTERNLLRWAPPLAIVVLYPALISLFAHLMARSRQFTAIGAERAENQTYFLEDFVAPATAGEPTRNRR